MEVLLSGFQVCQRNLERIAVAHLVMANFLEANGRGGISGKGGILGELQVHGVNLVGLASDGVLQVVSVAAN